MLVSLTKHQAANLCSSIPLLYTTGNAGAFSRVVNYAPFFVSIVYLYPVSLCMSRNLRRGSGHRNAWILHQRSRYALNVAVP